MSSSFPSNGPTNAPDHKLDYLDPAAVALSGGSLVITASPRPSTSYWNTGLITTEGSTEGFELHQGDYWETRLRLINRVGAWQSLWTWGRDLGGVPQSGHGEVDALEYYGDNLGTFELSNRMKSGAFTFLNVAALGVLGGDWVTLGIDFRATSVDWYLNGGLLWQDRGGVPADWVGWPILELSVSDGALHAAPDSTTPLVAEFDYTRVYR